MNCKDIKSEMDKYFSNKLDKEREKELFQHINSCSNCKIDFLEYHKHEKTQRECKSDKMKKISNFYKIAMFIFLFIIILIAYKYSFDSNKSKRQINKSVNKTTSIK